MRFSVGTAGRIGARPRYQKYGAPVGHTAGRSSCGWCPNSNGTGVLGEGLPTGAARALANAGFLNMDDLRSANAQELASIPRVGRKSLAILHELMGRAHGQLKH